MIQPVSDLFEAYRDVLTRGRRSLPQRRNKLTRFPGLIDGAHELGVSRQHLYFVLAGERRSPRIEAYAKEKGWMR